MYVVVQIYPLFEFYPPIVLGYGNGDNEFETMENKIETKDQIEPQHIHQCNTVSSAEGKV